MISTRVGSASSLSFWASASASARRLARWSRSTQADAEQQHAGQLDEVADAGEVERRDDDLAARLGRLHHRQVAAQDVPAGEGVDEAAGALQAARPLGEGGLHLRARPRAPSRRRRWPRRPSAARGSASRTAASSRSTPRRRRTASISAGCSLSRPSGASGAAAAASRLLDEPRGLELVQRAAALAEHEQLREALARIAPERRRRGARAQDARRRAARRVSGAVLSRHARGTGGARRARSAPTPRSARRSRAERPGGSVAATTGMYLQRYPHRRRTMQICEIRLTVISS